nr:hypothetical protein [Desulforamulus aquiferis]
MGHNTDFGIPRMSISTINIAILHNKSPWLPMWWSAALPGLGHLCQGQYFRGLVLMSWEILVNSKARINMAILYTFTGKFHQANEVLDYGWALFYGVIFCFAIFDSYRISVTYNKLARLERYQAHRKYKFMTMSTYGVNYLDRANPWVALAWSALLSGFGHIYNHKALKGMILLGWTVAIIYFANINMAIIHTSFGRFDLAEATVNYQWLLFFPSLYIFAMWDAYNDTVEMNKLFAEEQKARLKKLYNPDKSQNIQVECQ